MKMIVGLGNPGKEYQNTRHNIGFMVIDYIVAKYNGNYKKKFFGHFYEQNICNEKVIFLKPQKFVNLSGEVIKDFVDYYKISIEDILIIHDDLDLDIGTFKLRLFGGNAGHNGLKNIEKKLGTQNYKRCKIGISNNKKIDGKDYVLGNLAYEEKIKINEIVSIMPNLVNDYITMTYDNLMNKYNKTRED